MISIFPALGSANVILTTFNSIPLDDSFHIAAPSSCELDPCGDAIDNTSHLDAPLPTLISPSQWGPPPAFMESAIPATGASHAVEGCEDQSSWAMPMVTIV